MDSEKTTGRFGNIMTCLGVGVVCFIMGVLAIPGKSGSPLIYIHIVYAYVIPAILGASAILYAFFPEKHKIARLGLIIGLVFIGVPFLISIIVSKL